jgi:transcriptional regulator with XRE-family HTH domain
MKRGPASTHELDQIALEFNLPRPLPAAEGALALSDDLCFVLAAAIETARQQHGLTRARIAERMSELTRSAISRAMLDAWTAPSRKGYRFPLELLPAFECATHSLAVTTWLANARGCRLLTPADVVDAELGKLDREAAMLKEKRRRLVQLRDGDGAGSGDA